MIGGRITGFVGFFALLALFADLALYHRWWFWFVCAWTVVGIVVGVGFGALIRDPDRRE